MWCSPPACTPPPHRYSASTRGVLPQYELCANYKRLQLWREYYFRYNPAMLPFTFL